MCPGTLTDPEGTVRAKKMGWKNPPKIALAYHQF
jgi:hypothetical protein